MDDTVAVVDRLTQLVSAARLRLGDQPALAPARARLGSIAHFVATRMRVALIGRVSAGKSTLANALLGGYRAPTGINEVTYNVTWISHGAEPAVTVHFRDGRVSQRHDIAELYRLAVRAPDSSAHGGGPWLDDGGDIAYLRVTDPARYLEFFDLIDTPGLDSRHGADSQHTLQFLDGPIDATVLVFSRAVHAAEPELLRRVHGQSLSFGPINTIAALTRVEDYWDWPDVPDPFPVARRVVEQATALPEIREVIHRLLPVASLVGAGASMLDERDRDDLDALSGLDRDALGNWLSRVDAFATAAEDAGTGVPADRRAALFTALSGYGVMLACDLLRDGAQALPELRNEMDRRSGTDALRTVLVEHFGNRAGLIKMSRAYAQVRMLPAEIGSELSDADREALLVAVREFSRSGLAEAPRYRALEVLRSYYDGRLSLSGADAADLLQVTGEHGTGVPDRLGLAADASAEELAARAVDGLRRWATRSVGPGLDGPTRDAAREVMRSYELLLEEIEGLW